MKYTTNEALEKILQKSKEIHQKREQRITAVLSAATAVLAVLLIGTVALLKGQGITEATASDFGAFLLPSEAGGYVLAGVIAFVLGIMIALFICRYKDRKKNKGETETAGMALFDSEGEAKQ